LVSKRARICRYRT